MGHRPILTIIVLVLCRETVNIQSEDRYTLTRHYRRGVDTFKVTVHRDVDRARSYATAEIYTDSNEWAHVVCASPSNWHDKTFVWHLPSLPALDPETGFINLRKVADELACEAMAIRPA